MGKHILLCDIYTCVKQAYLTSVLDPKGKRKTSWWLYPTMKLNFTEGVCVSVFKFRKTLTRLSFSLLLL